MAKIDLPYVQRFKDRHGKWRHYYRRKGRKGVPLPGEPGSTQFMVAYEAACGSAAPSPNSTSGVEPRTINALVIRYYASTEFQTLKPVTQANYRNILDRFRAVHGDKRVEAVETRHLDAIFDAMPKRFAAVNLRRRLSRVFRLAVRIGWRRDNPISQSEVKRPKTEGYIPWSEEDIAQFERHWAVGSKERLAFALLLYTGCRRSDVSSLGRQHVQDGRISVVQFKGGKRVSIPIHQNLKPLIEGHNGLTFVLTQYGKPFTHAGFTQWFVDKAKLAGLEKRTPHGLRKAAGRRLAEAGCSAKQIAAVLGHDTLRQVETYTRDADQSRLADGAFEILMKSQLRSQ